MKKLTTLVALLSLGLFAVGCTENGMEPAPPVDPGIEGGSGLGDGTTTIEEDTTIEETPPVTDEAPPETPEPSPETSGNDAAAPETGDAADPAPAEGETPQ